MNDSNKQILFEQMPIPGAVARLVVPTIMGSLVMILYNLADTYFVGYLNDPVQNAAVTLAAPMLLAFVLTPTIEKNHSNEVDGSRVVRRRLVFIDSIVP